MITGYVWTSRLPGAGVRLSYALRGPGDNPWMESFLRSLQSGEPVSDPRCRIPRGTLSANIGEAFATSGITEEGGGGERWTQRGMGQLPPEVWINRALPLTVDGAEPVNGGKEGSLN